jgi:hypothetical protein
MHPLRLKPGRRIGIAVIFIEAIPVPRTRPKAGDLPDMEPICLTPELVGLPTVTLLDHDVDAICS